MTKAKSTSPKTAASGAIISQTVTHKSTDTAKLNSLDAATDIAPNSSSEPDPKPKRTTKLSAMLSLLRRSEGARIGDLIAATNWQTHTIRASLSRLRKEGHVILATKDGRTDRQADQTIESVR